MTQSGQLYLSDLDKNAVARLEKNGSTTTVVSDPRLQWPDTFTEGPDGNIYISASHIHESPKYNNGQSARKLPYAVFKFKP